MKTNQSAPQKSTKPQANQQKKLNKQPENKDNLDSREGEEQIIKGDAITHNKKDQQSRSKEL